MGLRYCPKTTSGSKSKNDSAGISYKQQIKAQTVSIWALFTLKIFQKMRMSEKCHSNNSDSPLTSRHTDSGKKGNFCQFISRMMPFVIDPSAETMVRLFVKIIFVACPFRPLFCGQLLPYIL